MSFNFDKRCHRWSLIIVRAPFLVAGDGWLNIAIIIFLQQNRRCYLPNF